MMAKINLFVGLSPVASMDFKNFSPDKQVIFGVIDRLLVSLKLPKFNINLFISG